MGLVEITYQGHTVDSVRYRNARGYGPSRTVIEMTVSKFPERFGLSTPAAALRAAGDSAGQTVVRGAEVLPERLEAAGPLVMVETVGQQRFAFPPVTLWIAGAQRVVDDTRGRYSVVRIELVDERHFWDLGILRRSSWNRKLANGQDADPRSIGTRRQIAAAVVQDLFRAPKLATAPERWSVQSGPIEFPFGAPVVALRMLVEDGGAAEPCLRLDGTVALHALGEGAVAYAPEGKGANSTPVPEAFLLHEQGQGDSYAIEMTYAPRWVIVRGQVRVASVRLRCVPVFVLPSGTVMLVNEENVRELSGGLWGLTELRKFVLMPAAFQEDSRLPKPPPGEPGQGVARLFSTQAFRLWQIEGLDDDTPPEKRNRHVLDILDRAELGTNGRRLPPLVERVGFREVHVDIAGGGLVGAERDAVDRLNATSDLARQMSLTRVVPNPLTDPGGAEGYTRNVTLEGTIGADRLQRLSLAGFDVGAFAEKTSEARRIENLRELDASIASQRTQAYDDLYKARDAATGGNAGLEWELAKKFAAFEHEVRENASTIDKFAARGLFDTEDSLLLNDARTKLPGSLAALEAAVDRAISEAAQATRTQIREQGLGGRRREPDPKVVLVNHPLEPDTEATVYSAELGIVQTSGLAGHLTPDGKATAMESADFVEGEVWLTFGAVVRPRSSDPGASTQLREEGAVLGPLADSVTYFLRAFQRSGVDPVAVKLSDVPQGEGLVIVREDLPPELVPLTGSGNIAALEREAEAVARGIFATPDKVATVEHIYGRPWAVNPDGLVESVEVVSFEDPVEGTGFKTIVRCGYRPRAEVGAGQTRARPPRPKDLQDGARREGLTP